MASTTTEAIKVNNMYFVNFMKCVDALNSFFSSGYKTKNFPMIEDEDDIEPTILHIIKMMNNIDPAWIDNAEKIEDVIDTINRSTESIVFDESNEEGDINIDQSITELAEEFVSYKMLQFMADHKTELESLFDGIHSMKLFTTPSQYTDAMDLLSTPIKIDELTDGLIEYMTGGVGYKVFDVGTYVGGVFHSDDITLPPSMKQDAETERVKKHLDKDIKIIIEDVDVDNDDTSSINESYVYTERAEINFFEETNPPHIRYHEDSKKWQISKQFTAAITRLLAGLKTCDTTDDIEEFLNTNANRINPDDYTCMVLPVILARVFDDTKKFKNRVFDEKALKKYTDSYASIMKQNKGAKNFKNYDLFSVFKADKEGTMQFLEDFLTLRLVSDPNAYIKNHELLILFNIFDSRIYFDILYNVMPKSVQENEWKNEDNFVKTIRARLNANSRKANPYEDAKKEPVKNQALQSMEEVTEYVCDTLKRYHGDITMEDARLCGELHDLIDMEIATIESRLYNEGYSNHAFDKLIMEYRDPGPAEKGELPNYMRQRLQLEKETEQDDDESKPEQVPVPDGVPENPLDELADSVETRANVFGQDGKELDDAFGKDADVNPVDPRHPHKRGDIVYNITYNNSFNKTTNDMSENKSVRTNSHDIKNSTIKGGVNNAPTNSNNNGTPSATDTSKHITIPDTKKNDETFSTGNTIQEVFQMLYAEEPLFVKEAAVNNGPPKADSLTAAMDLDRKALAAQQAAKRTVNKGISVGKAIMKPIERTKDWLTKTVDSLIKRDEDKVKSELIENDSYRNVVFRASRAALKIGLLATAFAINPYLGFLAGIVGGAKELDKQTRLRKEVQNEYVTELKIIDERIKACDSDSYGESPEKRKKRLQEKARLMRLRAKMVEQASRVTNTPIRNPKEFT